MKNGRYDDKYGNVSWFKDGILHREDGPAFEYSSGTKAWCLNGNRHREDGPAYEHPNGRKEWYVHGKIHREDGPAVEDSIHGDEWYLNGVEYTEEEFNQWLEKKNLNEKLQSSLSSSPMIKRGKI